MPAQVAIQQAVTRIGGEPSRQEVAGRVWLAVLIAEVRAGVRYPRVARVLRKGSSDLRAGGIPLAILRQRHAMMGREPPIIAIARGKPVQEVQQRAFLPGA